MWDGFQPPHKSKLAAREIMHHNLSLENVLDEISISERIIQKSNVNNFTIWSKIKIFPELWEQHQYDFDAKFWVVAAFDNYCLYLNFVEGGWGWGKFESQGHISEYQWEQEELHEAFLWRFDDLQRNNKQT